MISIVILYLFLIFKNGNFSFSYLRSITFNVVSILTGTGYVTKEFDQWGSFPLFYFLILMFIGGCAGSTACGIKIFRVQILYRFILNQIKKVVYPRGIFIIKYQNNNVNDKFLASIISFIYLYIIIFFILTALLSLTGLDFITSISGAATSISNVGPGLGSIIGPNGNFSQLPENSKWILSLGMILGRLELFAILTLFLPSFWKKMINIKKQKKFSDLFKYFFEKRMMKILLLGAISGFPWVIIGSSLSLWLKEEGLSRSTIGWAGLIFAVYAFNYLWAPLIDRIYIPYLTKKIGHRKSWIFLMQSIILICLLFWNFVEPVNSLGLVIGIGLIVAIASATQDITVDALRIEQIRVDEKEAMSAGAAIAVVGWWTGYKLGGAISLNLAEFFENLGFDNYWELTFIGLGVVIILFNLGILFINEKALLTKMLKKS